MKQITRISVLAVIACFAILAWAELAYADVETAVKACVAIESKYSDGVTDWTSSGSGFVVTSDGFVVTNAHVIISNDITVSLTLDGHKQEVAGRLVYLDDKLDLAVIKVGLGGLNFLTFGNDSDLTVGKTVYAIGSPLIFNSIVTNGIYSQYNEELGMIMHTAALYHGNSGGPLVTEDGLVMGVNTLRLDIPEEGSFYFAIPAHVVSHVLASVYGQSADTVISVDPTQRIPKDEQPDNTTPAIPPAQTTPPDETTLPPSDGTTPPAEVSVDYVTNLMKQYPAGFSVASSTSGYSIMIPDFYTGEDLDYGSLGFKYDSTTDPYAIAIPYFVIVPGDPSIETLNKFKKSMWKMTEDGGFKMVKSDAWENSQLGSTDFISDAYVFTGNTTDTQNIGEILVFLTRVDDPTSFYCVTVMMASDIPDDYMNGITIPLILSVLQTFSTP